MVITNIIPPEIFELKQLEIKAWPSIQDALRASGVPLNDEETEEERKAREQKEREDKEREEREAKEKEEREKKEKEDDKDPDKDKDEVTLSRDEVARLRRKAQERDELEARDKKAKEEADRKKKQDEGRFQELLDDERKKTTDAQKERDEARAELADYKHQVVVTRVAERLHFKDASDAFMFLRREEYKVEVGADEREIERALNKVLKDKDYLKDKTKATGGSGGNGDGKQTGNWTIEQIRGMSTDQVNENWNKPGFQEALSQAGV